MEECAAYRPGPPESVPVSTLLISGSPRIAGEDPRYARLLAESRIPLPPVVVHRSTLRVVDGVHRVRAALLRGEERIDVSFVDGTPEDAFVLAVRLNTRHGMPLSRADRAAAAVRIIESHPHWSDRRIASVTGTSPTTVAALRSRSTIPAGQLNGRTGRDGRVRPLHADAAQARRRAGEFLLARPNASLREVAAVAGIAVATARSVRERLRLGEDPVPPKLRAAEQRDAPGGSAPASGDGTGARAPGAGEEVVQVPPHLVAHAAVPNLRKDPSLRFTEAGRTLLRLWSAHAMDTDRWKWLAGSVPAHRLSDAVWAAQHCAEQWQQFARDLELRAAGERDRSG
ncbi:DUF1013 domain-containing protein [Streptomyces rectiverticillatus]|uniref:ParB/RepB/Spo0J family partition protein n=1 Tax=Streptomyces rectiverticillatus TaxID=173860 RepID=UPI0015C3CF0D|nr:DUF1013 domain-containing protein [Streptomyces rectiverticillatus]